MTGSVFQRCEHNERKVSRLWKMRGYLVLAYDGWNCNQCGRKYFLRNGRTEEMWWKNQKMKW